MATVFMRWLETTPSKYDRGIQLLTLNKLRPLKEQIASQEVRRGDRVLEIGCGTGTLTVLMAERGATVDPGMEVNRCPRNRPFGLPWLNSCKSPAGCGDYRSTSTPSAAPGSGSATRSVRWDAGRRTTSAGWSSSTTLSAASPAGLACCNAPKAPSSCDSRCFPSNSLQIPLGAPRGTNFRTCTLACL